MSELGNKLKQLVGNYGESTYPTDLFCATMITPTQFQLDNSQGPIPESMIIIPEHLSRKFKVKVEGDFHGEHHSGELEIDNTLKKGDRVAVLRKQGGGSFYILGRL